jgi:hypothetical protein
MRQHRPSTGPGRRCGRCGRCGAVGGTRPLWFTSPWATRRGVSRSIRTTTRTTRPSVDTGVVALRDTQRARRLSASAEPLPVQRSSRTGRAPNLEALHVSSVMLVSVEDGAEPHLERQFLPSVAIEVEAECVQAFVTKCIWRGSSCVGLYRHGHDGKAGCPRKR